LTGALAACEGIGGMVGSLCVGILARERTLLAFYFFGPFLYLAVILSLSFHVSIAAMIVALLLASLGAACFSATQYALVYLHAPPSQRGRATGLLALGIGFGTIGLYSAGEFFTHMPPDTALMIMAVGGLVPLTLLGMVVAMEPTAAQRPRSR
jgi:MFS family permease